MAADASAAMNRSQFSVAHVCNRLLSWRMAQRNDRASATFSQSKRLCVTLSLMLIMTFPHQALAEPAPGDACTTPGAYTHAGGPEVDDDRGFMLVCSGGSNVWESVVEYSTESGRAMINVDYDGTSCTAAKTGRLRYNPSTDVWEYCDGSDPWLPFEQAGSAGLSGPADCPDIGDQCDDDTIYAGYHPTLSERLFTHPSNQSGNASWSIENVATSEDAYDGKVNQDWIVANKTIANYPAFKLCDDLNLATALGHSDWYLPSQVELFHMWTHRIALNAGPGTDWTDQNYWASNNVAFSTTAAYSVVFNVIGAVWHLTNKSTQQDVRCIRRG